MKYTLRIPTEMYAYIEAEYEGEPEDAVRAYYDLTAMVKVAPVPKINASEFARICDEFLKTGKVPNGGDLELNPSQKQVLSYISKIVRERNK